MKAQDALWAKKDEVSGVLKWLPLMQHLEDTVGVAIQLWNHWLAKGTKQTICNGASIDKEQAVNLVAFLAASHDIGKATPAFQTIKNFQSSASLDEILIERLEKTGFKDLSHLVLSTKSAVHHTVAGEKILRDFGVDSGIASIIGAHHGKPIDSSVTLDEQIAYEAYYYQESDPSSETHLLWKKVQRELFQYAMDEGRYRSVEEIPIVPQAYLVLLSGLIIMADWIASNTYYFPLIDIGEEKVEDAEKRLERGWSLWEQSDLWAPEVSSDIVQLYEDRFGFSPRVEQKIFSEIIAATDEPGIFIFEAPMGKGKTEAALIGAEQLAVKTNRSGLFFGLPTQATSNSMFTRIEDWLERTMKGTASIQLAHGKASLNKAYSNLAGKGHLIDVDSAENGTVIANAWFRGKKTTALDDFVVGTVDQFLLASLKQKHLALRHLGFSKKVVIIDEVHAYDAYMSEYLLESISWMAAYDVPVIILSATLPAERREAMVKAYLKGKGIKWKEVELPEEGLQGEEYPLITYTDGKNAYQFKDFPASENMTISLTPLKEEELYDVIEGLVGPGGVLGIVVNTIGRAQRIGKELMERYGDEVVSVLHSSFTAIDRVKKENELMEIIGKDSSKKGVRPDKKIIVGTQVIEQSLDIDFDVMISDLAPVDLLIQRAGRLHRHKETVRPEHLLDARLYIMGMSNEEYESGSEHIYGEYLLRETKKNLKDTLFFPADISPLVQKVYRELGDRSDLETDHVMGKFLHEKDQKQQKARVFRLSSPKRTIKKKSDGTLTGWLKNDLRGATEEGAYGRVRDIDENLEVILLKKWENGYGFFEDDRDISQQIDDPAIAMAIVSHTVQLPKRVVGYGGKAMDKTIDFLEKHTLQYFIDWQNDPWLKGSLAILFNEDQTFSLNGYLLRYDTRYGLTYEGM